ncbi:hypothetical protein M413DRAFT_13146 [Hebeloma cylindrosporum]|uniref:Uncharacterized protein n=1 Tax=Hebeloma cylindrosporum TaxID=76867 RepID=A0A0C2XIR2_HEBCY|nr:hypothetical protein M413DRAFT_13146 [Hebeloma cylindrosporum h7]
MLRIDMSYPSSDESPTTTSQTLQPQSTECSVQANSACITFNGCFNVDIRHENGPTGSPRGGDDPTSLVPGDNTDLFEEQLDQVPSCQITMEEAEGHGTSEVNTGVDIHSSETVEGGQHGTEDTGVGSYEDGNHGYRQPQQQHPGASYSYYDREVDWVHEQHRRPNEGRPSIHIHGKIKGGVRIEDLIKNDDTSFTIINSRNRQSCDERHQPILKMSICATTNYVKTKYEPKGRN